MGTIEGGVLDGFDGKPSVFGGCVFSSLQNKKSNCFMGN